MRFSTVEGAWTASAYCRGGSEEAFRGFAERLDRTRDLARERAGVPEDRDRRR